MFFEDLKNQKDIINFSDQISLFTTKQQSDSQKEKNICILVILNPKTLKAHVTNENY